MSLITNQKKYGQIKGVSFTINEIVVAECIQLYKINVI